MLFLKIEKHIMPPMNCFWFFFSQFINIFRAYRNWQLVLFHCQRFVFAKPYIAVLRNGNQFWVRPGIDDVFIINEVFSESIYNKPQYGCEIKKDDVVVDIGGYIGDFAIYAADFVGKDGHVFTFEPVQEVFDFIQKNVALSQYEKRITAFYAGIGKENTQSKIFLSARFTNAGSSQFQELQSDSSKTIEETIQILDIQELASILKMKKVDVIKIDTEGAEYDIVPRLPKDILHSCRCLMIEYHHLPENDASEKTLVAFLGNNGYETHIEKHLFIEGIGMIYAVNRLRK